MYSCVELKFKHLLTKFTVMWHFYVKIALLIFSFANSSQSVAHGSCLELFILRQDSQNENLVSPRFYERPNFRKRYVNQSAVENFQKQIASTMENFDPIIAFEYYFSLRMKPYNRRFIRQIQNILDRKLLWLDGTSVGGSTVAMRSSWFDKLLGHTITIGISVHPELAGSAIYFSVLVHELAHAIQLNNYKEFGDVSASKQSRYEAEFNAVLAEWEFWQLIPKREIEQSILDLQSLPEGDGKKAFLLRLQYAHSDFENFISQTGYASPDAVEESRSKN